MFFSLSKVFWILAQPSHWLGFLTLATAISLALRWNRAARFLGVAAALLLVLAGFLAVPLARNLEDRYPRPPWPAHVDGILVLGAGFDTALFQARGVPQSNEGIWRLEAGFAAARRYPQARLVFSGGSGALGGAPFSEAETARRLLRDMGQDPRQLTLESRSRNTYENLLFTKAL
ncbi:MAG: YdcF family protein, partial [Rhizomicrobium sp.]